MKASELIEKLKNVVAESGDLEVVFSPRKDNNLPIQDIDKVLPDYIFNEELIVLS